MGTYVYMCTYLKNRLQTSFQGLRAPKLTIFWHTKPVGTGAKDHAWNELKTIEYYTHHRLFSKKKKKITKIWHINLFQNSTK